MVKIEEHGNWKDVQYRYKITCSESYEACHIVYKLTELCIYFKHEWDEDKKKHYIYIRDNEDHIGAAVDCAIMDFGIKTP